MLTITSEPYNIASEDDPKAQPVPLSDCLQWCLQAAPSDAISVLGSTASVVISWPAVPTVPANGTTFTIWGKAFTVNNSTPFAAMTFEVTTSGTQTAQNMVNMLNGNLFFRRAATIQVTGVSSRDVLIDWDECREQASFGDDAMNMDNLITAGASVVVTNGVSPEYVAGYRIDFRLLKWTAQGGGQWLPVTEFEGIEPNKGCATVSELCLNLVQNAAQNLHTPMFDLVNEGEPDNLEENILGRFKLEYGWTYRDADCQPQSGTFMQSGEVLVWNAAFEPKEIYGVRRYWKGAVGGFPPGESFPNFLTTQPKFLSVCTDSFATLWMLNSFTNDYPDTASVQLRFIVYKKGVAGVFAIYTPDAYPLAEWYQPYIFNVSVGRVLDNVAGIDETTLEKYEVQIRLLDGSDVFIADASEYLTYVINPNCCEENTDLYFLTPAGGMGTLLCRVEEKEVNQEGTEIFTDVPCNTLAGYQVTKAKYGGRSLSNIRSFEKITVSAYEAFTPDYVDYFRQFKASPQRWIRIRATDGTWMVHKFIPDTGGVKIFRAGEFVQLTATGSLQDIPIQLPNELVL